MAFTFRVDGAKCKRDGICSAVCPIGIINVDDDGLPYLVKAGPRLCIGCGHCVAYCPHGAASLDGVPMRSALKVDRAAMPGPEAVENFLKSRRSIRKFSKKDVPEDVISKVLEISSWAPTAKNGRKIRWIVVDSADKMREVGALVAGAFDEMYGDVQEETPETRAASLLVNAWNNGEDPFLRGGRQMALAVSQGRMGTVDCAIALTYFELAAHALGVGCFWAGYVTTAVAHSPKLRKFFELGPDEYVGGGQIFGYPGIRPTLLAPREPYPVEWIR